MGRADPSRADVLRRVIACLLTSGYVLVMWTLKTISFPRPYFAAVTDGELTYFVGSLALARGSSQFLVLHPGMPVFLLGAGIIKLAGLRVNDIQVFLGLGQLLGLFATVGVLGLMTASFSRIMRPMVCVPVILSLFLHPSPLGFLTYWGPEMLLIPVASLCLWASWKSLMSPATFRSGPVVGAGLLAGYACGIKVIALPLVAASVVGHALRIFHTTEVPIVQLTKHLKIVRVLSVTLAVLSAVSLFFLQLRPTLRHMIPLKALFFFALIIGCSGAVYFLSKVWQQHPKASLMAKAMLETLGGVAIGWTTAMLPSLGHVPWFVYSLITQEYIGGTVVGDPRGLLLIKLGRCFGWAPLWSSLAVVTIILMIVALFRLTRATAAGLTAAHSADVRIGIVTLLVLLLSVAEGVLFTPLGELHPISPAQSLRYFLVAPVALVFSLIWLVQISVRGHGGMPRFMPVLAAYITFGVIWSGVQDFHEHRRTIQQSEREWHMTDRLLADIEGRLGYKPVALMWSISRPSFLLRWGVYRYSWGITRMSLEQEIDALYPREKLFDLRHWSTNRTLGNWDVILVKEREVIGEAGSAVKQCVNYLRSLGSFTRTVGGSGEPILIVSRQP